MQATPKAYSNPKSNPAPELLIIQLTKIELKELIDQAIKEALSDYAPFRQTSTTETYLTRAEVAKMFQVTLTAINKWSRQGKLNRHYIGSRVYFLRSEIDALFKEPTKFKKRNDGLQVVSRKPNSNK
jgi:hypothetical protein